MTGMADGRQAASGSVREAQTESVGLRAVTADEHHVIVTAGLTKIYPGGRKAVDGLDLKVPEGEIFALLGPNGAGKTTTVGMLTGRVIPSSGKAFVNGIDVAAEPGPAKAAVGVVSQANTLDRSLNVWENLYFHARYFAISHRDACRRIDELLQRFRLTARAKAAIPSLSGGMAKRVMLARAFLPRPAVVFLDEPTAGLDPQSRLVLWEILGELHAEGETIVLTTHYMEEAERLAERVAIMDRGNLLALDTPDRLRRLVGGGWIVVLNAEGDLDRLAECLRDVPGVVEATPGDDEVRVLLKEADGAVAAVVDTANADPFSLRSLSVVEASLETVFINLTGKELRE